MQSASVARPVVSPAISAEVSAEVSQATFPAPSPVAAPAGGPAHPAPLTIRPGLAHLERRAGRLLRALRDGDLLRRLGYVRLGDYVIERLGVSYRTAQEWMRVDESLERAPLVAVAFDSGEITSAQVRLLSRVVGAEDEAPWVELARRLDVRGLARAIATWQHYREGVPLANQGEAGVPGNTGLEDVESDGEDLETVPVELSVPASLSSSWRETVTFARQLSGAAVSRGECLEMVVAELLGSLKPAPAAEADGGQRSAPPLAQNLSTGKPESIPDLPASARDRGESEGPNLPAPARRELGDDEAGLPSSAPRSGALVRVAASGSPQSNREESSAVSTATRLVVRAIHRELRELMAARQKREWSLAERLRGVAMMRAYRLDGFASLEEYARERFGLSPRGTYRLLALHRTLERLPALRRSFLAGRVTLRQALVLGSVATVVTESAWIGRARSVTLRRLEDEVCFWKHLKEVRPAVWELLEGAPLPKGIVLVPGLPARLSTSARREESTGTDLPASVQPWDSTETDLPTCAPPADFNEAGLPRSARSARATDPELPSSAPSRRPRLTAERLLTALAESEGSVPMPGHMVRIRLRVEPDVKSLWESAVAHCRATIGKTIAEWEVLALGLAAFWKTWDNKETRRQRRENPTIDRDGWRCMAPGCWSMGTGRLHEHHIIYKSHGGALEDPRNLVAACTQHHKRLLHEGFIRCTGEAPDELVWSFGVEEGQDPFLVYEGETLVAGEAA